MKIRYNLLFILLCAVTFSCNDLQEFENGIPAPAQLPDTNEPSVTGFTVSSGTNVTYGSDITISADLSDNSELSQVIIHVIDPSSSVYYTNTIALTGDSKKVEESLSIPLVANAPRGAGEVQIQLKDTEGNFISDEIPLTFIYPDFDSLFLVNSDSNWIYPLNKDAIDSNLWMLVDQTIPKDFSYFVSNTRDLSGYVWGMEDDKIAVKSGSTTDLSMFKVENARENLYNFTINTYEFTVVNDLSPSASSCGLYCTMAIIGSATPGGWGTDTDMYLADPSNLDEWKIIVYLNNAAMNNEMKFRANDIWGNNDNPNVSEVKGADFSPISGLTGTAVEGDPNNRVIADAGYYEILFNASTLEYSFTLLSPTDYTTIGLIGDGAGGWSDDVDMTVSASNSHLWTLNYDLNAGNVKFRAENDWDNSDWGGNPFPSGIAILESPNNIPTIAGNRTIQFNDITGYAIFMIDTEEYTSIGLVGEATPGGWPGDAPNDKPDILLTKDPTNPYLFTGFVKLTSGQFKIRANQAWATSWGKGTDFTQGISTTGDNFVAEPGIYFVSFNTATKEYKFLK